MPLSYAIVPRVISLSGSLILVLTQDVQRVTRESSLPAMKFLFGLKKLVSVVDPLARALLCLESSHSTIGDNHIFWMASLSMIDELFRTPDGPFTEEEITRLRAKITRRFNQTINEPPNDVYLLGSFGDPRMYVISCLEMLLINRHI
jgi:hypothetical protein